MVARSLWSALMRDVVPVIAFAECVIYAVVGNAVVFLTLTWRRTPLRWVWAGMPFYLYGICNHASPPAGRALTAFALSTNIAALLAVPAAIWLVMVS